MRLLYSIIYAVALFVVFPFEYKKRPPALRARWLREKLGHISINGPGNISGDARRVWVHAVSVGEVIAAVTFIRALKEKHPALKVVVSTITDTGQAVARQRLGALADIVYMPFDLPLFMRRAIRVLEPSLFITIETEIWPGAVWCMKEAGVPVAMLNGRISEGSFRGYRKIRFIMKKILNDMDLFCMQDQQYARRITSLGAPGGRVHVTGNFKFDINIPRKRPAWGKGLDGPVIVAGSTHEGEEELLINVFSKLLPEFRSLTLVVAPRHPERFAGVQRLLMDKGINFIRRTAIEGQNLNGQVVLLDTVGELTSAYALCDIAVVGGSFIPHGGQNPLEPAFFRKPVVCGPHMGNFPFIKDFYSQDAAVATTEEGLYGVLRELLLSPESAGRIGERAGRLLQQNQGAVKKSLDKIETLLG